jgi:hypothetical protein
MHVDSEEPFCMHLPFQPFPLCFDKSTIFFPLSTYNFLQLVKLIVCCIVIALQEAAKAIYVALFSLDLVVTSDQASIRPFL